MEYKGHEINRRLLVLKELMKQRMQDHFKELNLTGSQAMIVRSLAHDGSKMISELSAMMSLSNATVSGIIDRLEKQGTVKRVRSEEDRRKVYVELDEDFRKNMLKKHQEIERQMMKTFESVSVEDINTIILGLETLERILREEHND